MKCCSSEASGERFASTPEHAPVDEASGLRTRALKPGLPLQKRPEQIALDEKLPEAHLQLGHLYSDQREYDKSVPQYTRALELDPNLTDAYYHLGTDYVHLGQKDKAQKEFDVYQKLRTQHLAEVEKERSEVQQFVIAEKAASANKP